MRHVFFLRQSQVVTVRKRRSKGASVRISHSSYSETQIHRHWRFNHQFHGGLDEKQKKRKVVSEREKRETSISKKCPCKMIASIPSTFTLVEQPLWPSSWMEQAPSVHSSCAQPSLGTCSCRLTTRRWRTNSCGCSRNTS